MTLSKITPQGTGSRLCSVTEGLPKTVVVKCSRKNGPADRTRKKTDDSDSPEPQTADCVVPHEAHSDEQHNDENEDRRGGCCGIIACVRSIASWLYTPAGLLALTLLVMAGICVFMYILGVHSENHSTMILTVPAGLLSRENTAISAIVLACLVELVLRVWARGARSFCQPQLISDGVIIVASVVVQWLIPPFGATILLLRLPRLFYIAHTTRSSHFNSVSQAPHRLSLDPDSGEQKSLLRASTQVRNTRRSVGPQSTNRCILTLRKVQAQMNALDSLAIDEIIHVFQATTPVALYNPNMEEETDQDMHAYINTHFSLPGWNSSGKTWMGGGSRPSLTIKRAATSLTHFIRRDSFRVSRVGTHDSQTVLSKQQIKTIGNLSSDEILEVLTTFDAWNFDIFDLQIVTHGNGLVAAAEHIFNKMNLFHTFNIPRDKFYKFMFAIQAGYRAANPYHNAVHAADIAQAMHWLLHEDGGDLIRLYGLTPLECLTAVLAAIIHDFKHPGVNNGFAVKKNAMIAIMANDASVLENYHLSQAFQLMQKPDMNILQNIGEEQYRKLRTSIITVVLATDMANHFSHMTQLQDKIRKHPTHRFITSNDKDRTLLLQMAMHYADVSNPARTLDLAQRWGFLVCEEFYLQGDLEKHLAIPVSPFYDRDTPNISKSQRGFIQYVVKPFTETMAKAVLEEEAGEALLKQVRENLAYWTGLKYEAPWNLSSNLLAKLPKDMIPPKTLPNPETECKRVLSWYH